MEDFCEVCNQPRSKHGRRDDGCPEGRGRFREKACPTCKKEADGPHAYCPKHRVLLEGTQLENEKKMQKLRERKAFKAELREALKDSPLAGYNPNFDKARRGGYDQ